MILTLAVGSLARTWRKGAERRRQLLEVPQFTIRNLGLRGLNINASLLAGWGLEDLDALRDRADKAACPCLVLTEDIPQNFVRNPDQAKDRLQRLASAATRLGCNSLAISVESPDTDDAFEATAARLRETMPVVERVELNLLLAPHDGVTADPDRLTDLIKRVGGFRIGSLPSFGAAAKSKNPIAYLRKVAPYAGAIHATVTDFTRGGKQPGYDLGECVRAIRSVGFTNTLAIDYVGHDDPIPVIEKARDILQEAIDAQEPVAADE